jgi:membrane protease YdiL (CAAX protease family)
LILAIALLALILLLLCEPVQKAIRPLLDRPAAVLIAAAALASIFCAAAAWYAALGWTLAALVFAYTLAPAALVLAPPRAGGSARTADLAAILALWLPLEFAVGAALISRPVQGILHAIAYGIAVILALLLFLGYRCLPGMKYNPPRRLSDLGIALAGFLSAAVVLIPVGIAVGFLGPAHAPTAGAAAMALRVALIFAGTALPEEILFRSLIQNWLVHRLGSSNSTIGLAALIFGLSHLNNGPAAAPNWRYALVATLAGFIFGKVFQRSTTILASAFVHTGVNAVKSFFF